MIIFGTCVGGDGQRYESVALPAIREIAATTDEIRRVEGSRGLAAAYNELVFIARQSLECEALVLLHDDVELVDVNFRAKVQRFCRDDGVGVVGVVGGAGLTGLAWWRAARCAGAVMEEARTVRFGPESAAVDAVDGMLLVITRRAFEQSQFDESAFPAFHGYDVDYCLSVRDRGLGVRVEPIEVLHRTKGGFGDLASFAQADRRLCEKWPTWVRERRRREAYEDQIGSLRLKLRKATHLARGGRQLVRRTMRPAGDDTSSADLPEVGSIADLEAAQCPICLGSELADSQPGSFARRILDCSTCGSGVTWPPPRRELEGPGIWEHVYGGARLAKRSQWTLEAAKRLDYTLLHAPDGVLLEVGAGTGEFVDAASKAGFDAYGVEVSEWAAERAQELGARVLAGFLTDWSRKYAGYRADVVAMWHVLEHIPNPHHFLQEVRGVLRPGGVLVGEVPNFGSCDARRLRELWHHSSLEDHVVHYTRASLKRLLEDAGFEVSEVTPVSERIYASKLQWQGLRRERLVAGTGPPSFDLLRVVARVSDAGFTTP